MRANKQRGERLLEVNSKKVLLRWTLEAFAALFDAFETEDVNDVIRKIIGCRPDNVKTALDAMVAEGDADALWGAIGDVGDLIAIKDMLLETATVVLPPDDDDEEDGDKKSGKPEAGETG